MFAQQMKAVNKYYHLRFIFSPQMKSPSIPVSPTMNSLQRVSCVIYDDRAYHCKERTHIKVTYKFLRVTFVRP
jgi:hypothetical protein